MTMTQDDIGHGVDAQGSAREEDGLVGVLHGQPSDGGAAHEAASVGSGEKVEQWSAN